MISYSQVYGGIVILIRNLVLVGAAMAAGCLAQETRSVLFGRVLDPNGGSIAGVGVVM